MTTREFEAEVIEHKDRVHNYARGILHDAEDAKDVAQECLIRLWRHREQIEPGAGCRSWLLRSGSQPLYRPAPMPFDPPGSRPE